MPSLESSINLIFAYASFLEPLGLAPLEAMSFGLPVVAIKEGGLRETVIDGYNGLSWWIDLQNISQKKYLI